MGEFRQRMRVATSAAVISLVGVTCITACGSSSGNASLEGSHATSSSLGPGDDNRTTRPHVVDPTAPPYRPVVRNGKPAHPTMSAKPEPFTKTVRYPDHISMQIMRVTQSVTTGHGPGVIPGRPMTTMKVRFTNDSGKAVNLGQVVVTVEYGMPALLAQPVYQAPERDFSSIVSPGHSAEATYAFSVPRADLNNVTMRVDFDGLHAAATFTGVLG